MAIDRVLVINPGSTSTKVAVFENTTPLCSGVLRHGADGKTEPGKGKMPASKGKLTPEQIAAIAEYVKTIK